MQSLGNRFCLKRNRLVLFEDGPKTGLLKMLVGRQGRSSFFKKP